MERLPLCNRHDGKHAVQKTESKDFIQETKYPVHIGVHEPVGSNDAVERTVIPSVKDLETDAVFAAALFNYLCQAFRFRAGYDLVILSDLYQSGRELPGYIGYRIQKDS